jgi:hypothetical protein
LTVTGGVALTASAGQTIVTEGFTRFRIQINNTGGNPLTGLEIATRAHADSDMQIHLNTGTHFKPRLR